MDPAAHADVQLGPKLERILTRFEGRTIDHVLLSEMNRALNDELAPILDGRRIHVLLDGAGLRALVLERAQRPSPERPDVAAAALEAVKAALAA